MKFQAVYVSLISRDILYAYSEYGHCVTCIKGTKIVSLKTQNSQEIQWSQRTYIMWNKSDLETRILHAFSHIKDCREDVYVCD